MLGNEHILRFDRPEHQAGISLVEVLAAVFIVGLMSSLVVLTMPREAPPERQFAGALQEIIEDSIDRSILRGAPVAIDIRNNVIRVHDWKQSEWNRKSVAEFNVDGKSSRSKLSHMTPIEMKPNQNLSAIRPDW